MEQNAFRPLALRCPGKKPKIISTVGEAFEFLKRNVPKARCGPMWQRAKIACSAALEGGLTADEARSAFMEAVVQADLTIEDMPDSLIETLVAKAFPSSIE